MCTIHPVPFGGPIVINGVFLATVSEEIVLHIFTEYGDVVAGLRGTWQYVQNDILLLHPT